MGIRPRKAWKFLGKSCKRSSGLRISGKRGELVRLLTGDLTVAPSTKTKAAKDGRV